MSKKTTGTDIGYRAYFAAFAVMLVIVIAAICILSGCLDSVIFKADVPSDDTGNIDVQPSVGTETGKVPDTDPIADVTDTDAVTEPDTTDVQDTEEETTAEDTTEAETTKADTTEADTTEKDTTAEVTTPEVTTPEVTTPEVTTPDVTTPEATTERIDRAEIITERDDHLLYDSGRDGLVITGYDGNPTKLTIARELDGVEVVSVGKDAFSGIGTLVEVRISAGVKSIGSGAFANCPVLNYVYIPTTVKDIASNAFEGSADVIIYCAEGSYAEHFASDNGIECRAE